MSLQPFNSNPMYVPFHSVFAPFVTVRDLNQSPRNWGLAAIYAYRAYKEEYLLDIAISNWNEVKRYLITPEESSNGFHPAQNTTIASKCSGGTSSRNAWSEFAMTQTSREYGGGSFLGL